MIKKVDLNSALECLDLANFYDEHYNAPQYLKPSPNELMFSNKDYYIYIKDGKTVGATSLLRATDHRLETWSTLVHPNYRGQGIASQFNDFAEDYAKNHDFGIIRCNIYVDNLPSLILKLKRGYIICGTLPDYDAPGKHEYILTKEL